MLKNSLLEYHDLSEKYPDRFSQTIKQQIALQKIMLKKFDFKENEAEKVIVWIEKFCILPEGENAGQKVKLMLWQKWFIYSIFAFWGTFEEPEYNDRGEEIGIKKKHLRVVNDILMVIASGNAKTTFLGFINTYLLYTKDYPSAKIYIGSNAQKQSKLCYDTTLEIIRKNAILKKHARLVESKHLISIERNNSLLMAMSSDGKNFEGINPTNIMLDEIHEFKDSAYADNLRKSVKRDDSFVFETTTMGTVRGGYLDSRIEYAERVLNGEVENYRFFCCIFKQESEEEVIKAYEDNDMSIMQKSNPSLGFAISITRLKDKLKEMIDDPTKKSTILCKNCNIPQNNVNSYFSERECRTKVFDENIFYNAPVFMGLDMAYTRNPDNDLTCLTMMMKNPFTEAEYFKDFYFIPKYWERTDNENGQITIDKLDMIKYKSKTDTNILYNQKQKNYGYQLYADRGDVIIVDEELIEKLVSIYGEQARFDCTGITEKFIILYICYLEKIYNMKICKFGFDPNKASEIESFINANAKSWDGLPPAIRFQMERTDLSTPIIESTKDIRARELVYDNNKLTELHFASAQAKNIESKAIIFTNPRLSRKDGVIAHLAARSAYNVFVVNNKTGLQNKQLLDDYWRKKGE